MGDTEALLALPPMGEEAGSAGHKAAKNATEVQRAAISWLNQVRTDPDHEIRDSPVTASGKHHPRCDPRKGPPWFRLEFPASHAGNESRILTAVLRPAFLPGNQASQNAIILRMHPEKRGVHESIFLDGRSILQMMKAKGKNI